MRTRLEAFPRDGLDLRAGARILWDRHQVPYVHADEDDDVPYLIGLVHAHLRLGQMELLKRISQGRMAEMGGPLLRRVDHAIRAIDLGRAVPDIMRTMDVDARRWVQRYVDAINQFKRSSDRVPPDIRPLGIDPDEPWTLADALTVGRLASADINWGKWAALFPLRGERGYDDYLARLRAFARAGTPTFGPGTPTPLDALLDVGKTGSNAFAVSPERSTTGAAMLAGDPHLGLPQPNIWCLLGYRSPRSGAIGLTIPGVPFVLVGRNDHIAWGGTNMHSLSSVLYDTNGAALSERRERIRTRWWRDAHVRVRESPDGPIITDAPMFRKLHHQPAALRWRGHDPSDEAGAMLRLNRARTWDDFKSAFATWSTGGQNFLYADTQGNIGQVLAIEFVAAAGHAAYEHVVSPDEPRFTWKSGVPSVALPAAFNPADGFLVSANNTPTLTDPPILAYGNTNDRVHRITARLADGTVSPDDLMALQRDVFAETSLKAARAMTEAIASSRPILKAIEAWNGHYASDSVGALAYQFVLDRLSDLAYRNHYAPGIIRHLKKGPHIHEFMRHDIESGRIDARTIDRAAQRASRRWRPTLTWGDRHRIGLTHPIGRVPFVGRRFHFGDLSTGGTTTTIHKSNHPVSSKKHKVRFGACARHVFDMSGPDENHVVLLGGQDGWLDSVTMLDQVDLWQRGEFIRMPLTPQGQESIAVMRTTLEPGR